MIDKSQLRNLIIAPSLDEIGFMSKDAEELIYAIACHESKRGTYIKQVHGCALGIYQIEPATYYDIFDNFLVRHKNLERKIFRAIGVDCEPNAERMIWDMKLATIMCRVFFLRIEEPLPPSNNIDKIALYWKKYYNTNLGSGTIEKFKGDYGD